MRKGAKRFFGTAAVLALAGGAVFFFGWVQFRVRTDECGVLVSKTGGVYPRVIEKGAFCWRWEPLLPTNATVLTFQLRSRQYHSSVRGSLPSADVYSAQVKGSPDFAYSFDIDVSLRMTEEELLRKAGASEITTDAELDDFLRRTADRVAELAAAYLIAESAADPTGIATSRSTGRILAGIGTDGSLDGIEVVSLFVRDAKIPDAELYGRAKRTYMTFQDYVDEALIASAQHQADTILSDNRAVSRLTQIGETLRKYPELSEILKNGDPADFITSLNGGVR